MIIAIACILFGGYLFYKIEAKSEFGNLAIKTLFTCIGLLAGSLVGLLFASFFSVVMPRTVESFEFEKTKLVALGGSSELGGSFFLASGSIGKEQFYKFYYELPDGGKKFGKLNAEKAKIYEEERKDAYLTKVCKRNVYSNQTYFWLVPKFIFNDLNCDQAIHVPKGTIKVEYNLDLK